MCGSADKNIVPHKKLGEFPVELNKNFCLLSANTNAEKITSHQDESLRKASIRNSWEQTWYVIDYNVSLLITTNTYVFLGTKCDFKGLFVHRTSKIY